MFPQQNMGNQVGGVATASQQGNDMLGNPQIQTASMPAIDPGTFNSTAFQSNPGVANMIKALKGNM